MATTDNPTTGKKSDSSEKEEKTNAESSQNDVDLVVAVDTSSSSPKSESGSFDSKMSGEELDPDFLVDSDSDSKSKKSSEKRSKGDKCRDFCAPPFLFIFFVLNIYAMITYMMADDDSGCKLQVEDGELTVSPAVFTFMAAICSIAMLVVMWCSYRASNAREFLPPRNQRENFKAADKGERCHTFCKFSLFFLLVKIVLGCAGLWMWISEFSDDCRQETIGMVILFWSAFQFSFLCLSAALIGFLGYMAAQEGVGSMVEDALGE